MLREQAAIPMSDLNTTPLVDVMLVLLIIFMISAPLLSHKLTIPMPGNPPLAPLAEPVRHIIGISAEGVLTLDDSPIAHATLLTEWRNSARLQRAQQPEYRIEAAAEVRFEVVAGLLADGRRLGVERIGLADTL
jgi:biopolymer transport protein ExbD